MIMPPTATGDEHAKLKTFTCYHVGCLLKSNKINNKKSLTPKSMPSYIHQGCWSWGKNVVRTAGSRTQVAVQSRGPGNTHREVTYLSWVALPYAYACGCVLANADKRLILFNTYRPLLTINNTGTIIKGHQRPLTPKSIPTMPTQSHGPQHPTACSNCLRKT